MNNQTCDQCEKDCKQIEKSVLLHCKHFKQKPVQTTLKFKETKVNTHISKKIDSDKL